MTDETPLWRTSLLESMVHAVKQRNVLLDELLRETREREERDKAFLASLPPWRRRLELGKREARRRRRRAAWLLEEYVTFRFERRRPRDDG